MIETYIPTAVQGSFSGDYQQVLHWSLKEKPSRTIMIQLLLIPSTILFGFLFITIANLIGRQPFNFSRGTFNFGILEVGKAGIGLAGIVATIVLHELAHGLAMGWHGARPRYGAVWKHLMFYATAPGYGFRRNSYILVAVLPLVGLSCLAILGMVLLRGTDWVALLTLCAVVNASGAIGDLCMVFIVLHYPETACVVDETDGFRVLIRRK